MAIDIYRGLSRKSTEVDPRTVPDEKGTGLLYAELLAGKVENYMVQTIKTQPLSARVLLDRPSIPIRPGLTRARIARDLGVQPDRLQQFGISGRAFDPAGLLAGIRKGKPDITLQLPDELSRTHENIFRAFAAHLGQPDLVTTKAAISLKTPRIGPFLLCEKATLQRVANWLNGIAPSDSRERGRIAGCIAKEAIEYTEDKEIEDPDGTFNRRPVKHEYSMGQRVCFVFEIGLKLYAEQQAFIQKHFLDMVDQDYGGYHQATHVTSLFSDEISSESIFQTNVRELYRDTTFKRASNPAKTFFMAALEEIK